MKENQTIINYPSKNKQIESYKYGDAFVTKSFYDAKDAYVKELITVENGVKEVKHFTVKGVLSKLEYFVGEKRHGVETRYFIPKDNKSVKSAKTYSEGKLHGECVTYNYNDQIIKQEVYAQGKLVLKYLRDNNEITKVQIVDKESVNNLPKAEFEKLQDNIEKKPDWFELELF